MQLNNSTQSYGWIHIAFHWSSALAIFGLFALGLWMVDLNFYSPWYHDAPLIHKSIGLVVMGIMGLRLIWKWLQPTPSNHHSAWERRIATIIHTLLYLLVFALGFSGYLISTAEGQGISVFNGFDVPALPALIEHQADVAGQWHFYLAISLMCLVALHLAGALKHHFIDQDLTLTRMFKPTNDSNTH